MESYPVPSQRLENVPEPLLAGVLGGVGFMCLALAILLGSAYVISRKRNRRCRHKKDGKMPLTPETRDTHVDELHHEYHHLFNKIFEGTFNPLYKSYSAAWIWRSSCLLLLRSVVKVIDVIYITC